VLNVSGAVVKQDGGWRFTMLHMSNMTGGPRNNPKELKVERKGRGPSLRKPHTGRGIGGER